MSMLLRRAIQQSFGGAGVSKLFDTVLYTGNSVSRSIETSINNASGSLVWIKERTSTSNHKLSDTARGATKTLTSNDDLAEQTETVGLTAFNSDGFDLGTDADFNQNGEDYVAWNFLKSEKFLDIITYTGDGVAGREISHSLGTQAGFVFVKNLGSSIGGWYCLHKDMSPTKIIRLHLADPEASNNAAWNNTAPDDTKVTLGTSTAVNRNGNNYVMYVFAHDPEGVINCGSYTGTNADIELDLGWEEGVQYILIKRLTGATQNWFILDTARGIVVGNDGYLFANTNSREASFDIAEPITNGIRIKASGTALSVSGSEYAYMVIRGE